MSYFTSIFHEEVIPVNEFKGEAEAYYARRRFAEKASGIHDKVTQAELKASDNEYRDSGLGKATTANEANERKGVASYAQNNVDRTLKEYDGNRKSRKAQKESFLPEIEII